jgi:hypothetical protein
VGSNGRKGRKRQLSEEHTAYLEQQHRKAAGTIAERHPDVTAVTLDLTFADPNPDLGKPVTKQVRREPASSALFVFDCPSRHCVDGGFDLDEPVHAQLSARSEQEFGRLVCQGWQDARRVGQNRCLYELRYEVRAEYRS